MHGVIEQSASSILHTDLLHGFGVDIGQGIVQLARRRVSPWWMSTALSNCMMNTRSEVGSHHLVEKMEAGAALGSEDAPLAAAGVYHQTEASGRLVSRAK